MGRSALYLVLAFAVSASIGLEPKLQQKRPVHLTSDRKLKKAVETPITHESKSLKNVASHKIKTYRLGDHQEVVRSNEKYKHAPLQMNKEILLEKLNKLTGQIEKRVTDTRTGNEKE